MYNAVIHSKLIQTNAETYLIRPRVLLKHSYLQRVNTPIHNIKKEMRLTK